jgi:hypothetical protein
MGSEIGAFISFGGRSPTRGQSILCPRFRRLFLLQLLLLSSIKPVNAAVKFTLPVLQHFQLLLITLSFVALPEHARDCYQAWCSSNRVRHCMQLLQLQRLKVLLVGGFV